MGPLQGGVIGMQPTPGLMTTADDPPGQSRSGMKKAECRMQNTNRAQSWTGLWNPFRISGYCRRDNFCRPMQGERGGEAGSSRRLELRWSTLCFVLGQQQRGPDGHSRARTPLGAPPESACSCGRARWWMGLKACRGCSKRGCRRPDS